MEKRKWGQRAQFAPRKIPQTFLISVFLFTFSFFLSSCAAPGDPRPPRTPVPRAVSDLAARQQGAAVVLTFTLPTTAEDGLPLDAPPDVELFRAFVPGTAAASSAALPERPHLIIPAALVDTYVVDGGSRVRFADPLPPEDLKSHAGEQLVYSVRTRAHRRRASADSNPAALRVYPAPEPPSQISAVVAETAVELSWTAPTQTITQQPIPALAGYRIYRSEGGGPAEMVGVAPGPSYRDARIEFGRAYAYTVASVAQFDADAVESAPSAPVEVTPRDTFPPSPPQKLIVIFVPAIGEAPAHFDLSWSLNPEPDVAGYHVYRSHQEGAQGQRVNKDLLPTPTFRDMDVAAGTIYFYRITALDRSGNESPPSAPAPAEAPSGGR